jgi:hypothetical protein
MAWGGEAQVPVRCLTCRCRPPGDPVPAGLQPSPWAAPPAAPIPQQPGAPAPLQAVTSAVEKLGDAMKGVGAAAGKAAQSLADAFKDHHAQFGVPVHVQPDPPAWITSGSTVAPPLGDLHALDHPARICTCDHWEDDHDRMGCTECDTCDAFVLQAAADAIEEVGSLDERDYQPVAHYVRLKDGRRIAMSDINDAAGVLSRRAKAALPPLPVHRRGMRLRGIREKKP